MLALVSSRLHLTHVDASVSAANRIAGMFPKVAAEDLWALERQQEMFEYPDQGYHEVFLKPDMAVRRARKIFLDLQREETPGSAAQAAE